MGYIILSDYLKQIQSDQLTKIQTGDANVLSQQELAAIAEARSYLTQKYIVDAEFTNTAVWNYATTYYAANRVYLDATTYSNAATYTLNALTLYNGNVYICTTAITVAEAFNISKWELLGAQYTLFYVTYPKPLFDLYAVYEKDDQVFYNNKIYKCLIATTGITQQAAIQYSSYNNIPVGNIFPDDPKNGSKYWQQVSTYSVTAGTKPTDTTKWTNGDNRNQQLLLYVIDITLYHLYSRIAPQNIPALRQDRYDNAKDWLLKAAKGVITAALPIIQPKQGQRIRANSNVKQDNRM